MTDELAQKNADDHDGAVLNASEDDVMAVLEAALAAPTVRRSRRA